MRQPVTLGATAAAGTGLLGASLAAPPGSRRFYRRTAATAAVWTVGGLAAGPVPRGTGNPVVAVGTGAGAFGAFYVAALVARRIPILRTALREVLRYAGGTAPTPAAVATTLANAVGEEVFFRGALYAAAGAHPVPRTALAYAAVTAATRNPALVLAALVMGTLFGVQRRVTGGVTAPLLTHVVWSALMLRYLPPLFNRTEE